MVMRERMGMIGLALLVGACSGSASPSDSADAETGGDDVSDSDSGDDVGDRDGDGDGNGDGVCGDGQVDTVSGEACDDGNQIDLDGCNLDCQVTGALVWEAELETDAESMVPADLVVTDDSIYAAAWFDERGLIARYSFDGQAQWTQELALDPSSKPEAMAWSADGFLMVLVRSSLFGTEQTLVQYSPDGEVLTTGALDDPSILVTDFLEVDGVILATGRRTIDDLHYGWLGVLDADGSVLETRFTHDREGTFLRLAIDGSGQPVVAGLVEPDPDEIIPHTGWVQALELDGTPRWSMNPFNIAADVAGTPDGVLVQATTSNSVRELMAVDPQGNVQWSRPYSFVSDGTPLGLNVDAVGHPVVTLLAYGDPQEGAPTLHKLDADGSDLWSEEEPGGELYDVPAAQDFVPETRAIVTLTQRGTFGNNGRVLLRLRNR